MILYRKSGQLRVRHATRPEPPFWYATAIAPYGPRRATPLAIEYLDLRASGAARCEVSVCDDVREQLERTTRVAEPVVVDATEMAEKIFQRGEDALRYCAASSLAPMHVISTAGALPSITLRDGILTIAAWPLDPERLDSLFEEASRSGWTWGVAIPLLYPVSTDLEALSSVVKAAARNRASFATGIAIDADPTAKHAIAQSIALDTDGEAWEMLFHADLDPVVIATERHIAALAAEEKIADFILPPKWNQKSNWNAAILLTLTAARMIAMEFDVELAGTLARSARVAAELEKPLARIAEAASLSIVEALDEVSVDILGEWLESGKPAFVEKVNREWRLRRDAGI